jgi:hypothetical protein
MTRDRPAGYHQDEATQHVCQVASTPAAPVGCAIPRQTAHPGSITQPRERLSPELLEHGLWSYVKPALKQIALDALNPYLHYKVKGREDYDAEQATRYGPLVEVCPRMMITGERTSKCYRARAENGDTGRMKPALRLSIGIGQATKSDPLAFHPQSRS